MDFSKTILETKTFSFKDFDPNDTDGTTITLINPNTSPAFCDERKRLIEEEPDTDKRIAALPKLVCDHLLIGWENLVYRGKPVKYTKKNALQMVKNRTFWFWISSIVFDPSNFIGDIDLDLEGIEKN